MKPDFDLHMHSGYSSDGQFSCRELAEIAEQAGLKTIALADHDTMRGVEEMKEEAAQKGISVIPAIECTTDLDGHSVHVLGYGCRIDDPYFSGLQEKLDKISSDAFEIRVDKLENKYGIHVDREDIRKRAAGKNPWFTLIDTILTDPVIQAHPDFTDYLPGGKRCDPAPVNFFWDRCQKGSDLYVAVDMPDTIETIKKIRESGGTAIIAHPFTTFFKQEERLQKVLNAGAEGLEVYSNYHNPEQIAWYKDFAERNGLLITCGSDFHGEKKPSIRMGEFHLQEGGQQYLTALLERIASNQEAWKQKNS